MWLIRILVLVQGYSHCLAKKLIANITWNLSQYLRSTAVAKGEFS